jgi:phosphonate transport system ATP-binding protein
MNPNAIEVRGLHKHFGAKPALKDVSLSVRPGEMVALLGASGSGKSTLLRVLAGLHVADAGSESRVDVLGSTVQAGGRLASDVRRTRAKVAMIFQQFNLVDRLPVMTNVLAGALYRMPAWRWALGRFSRAELARAHAALTRVGIEGCSWQRASTLSGGQQQRAAISRAVVQGAQVILADEPIASLDPMNAKVVMDSLQDINLRDGITVVTNLHTLDTARTYCNRIIGMAAGKVVFDGAPEELTREAVRMVYGAEAGSEEISESMTSTSIDPGISQAILRKPAPSRRPALAAH